ncbi:MAG: DUF5808 domain-containing protein [Myxococcota bacterium]
MILGQGGARLERGMFYINREDPSVLVEKRFGLGYTRLFA